MSIQVRIVSDSIVERKGIGKVSQKPYHLRIQTGHMFTVDRATGQISEFPDKFEMMLDADQLPYPRGSYVLADSAVFVNREGRLDVRPILLAAQPAKG